MTKRNPMKKMEMCHGCNCTPATFYENLSAEDDSLYYAACNDCWRVHDEKENSTIKLSKEQENEKKSSHKYAESEKEYFPRHWDDNNRNLVEFMIKEAYNAGYDAGFELGKDKAKNVALTLLSDMVEKFK